MQFEFIFAFNVLHLAVRAVFVVHAVFAAFAVHAVFAVHMVCVVRSSRLAFCIRRTSLRIHDLQKFVCYSILALCIKFVFVDFHFSLRKKHTWFTRSRSNSRGKLA